MTSASTTAIRDGCSSLPTPKLGAGQTMSALPSGRRSHSACGHIHDTSVRDDALVCCVGPRLMGCYVGGLRQGRYASHAIVCFQAAPQQRKAHDYEEHRNSPLRGSCGILQPDEGQPNRLEGPGFLGPRKRQGLVCSGLLQAHQRRVERADRQHKLGATSS